MGLSTGSETLLDYSTTMKDFPTFEKHMTDQGGYYTRVAIGGGGRKRFIAWSTTSAATTWCLQPEGWAFQSMTNFRAQKLRMKCAALGVDEACFLMSTDDRWWFNCASHYLTLDEIMKDLRHGDIEVSVISLAMLQRS